MHNPIQSENDLMVFLELMMESTREIIQQHDPHEMEVYLNRWNYISEYAAANPAMQISILIHEVSPDFTQSIKSIRNLYEKVSGKTYIAPQERKTPPEEFSISKFLQRVSRQREHLVDPSKPPTNIPPKNSP